MHTTTSVYPLADTAVAVAGTAVRLPDRPTTRGAMLCAPQSNTGNIYIGGSTVTKGNGAVRGIVLVPGGMVPYILPVSNTNLLYVNADNADDSVSGIVL